MGVSGEMYRKKVEKTPINKNLVLEDIKARRSGLSYGHYVVRDRVQIEAYRNSYPSNCNENWYKQNSSSVSKQEKIARPAAKIKQK